MNHEEYSSNDQAVGDLVRTVAPRNCSVATYSVLIGAVRGAIHMTAVRADGHVHRDDVLEILRTAMGVNVERVRGAVREAVKAERFEARSYYELCNDPGLAADSIADRAAILLGAAS